MQITQKRNSSKTIIRNTFDNGVFTGDVNHCFAFQGRASFRCNGHLTTHAMPSTYCNEPDAPLRGYGLLDSEASAMQLFRTGFASCGSRKVCDHPSPFRRMISISEISATDYY